MTTEDCLKYPALCAIKLQIYTESLISMVLRTEQHSGKFFVDKELFARGYNEANAWCKENKRAFLAFPDCDVHHFVWCGLPICMKIDVVKKAA